MCTCIRFRVRGVDVSWISPFSSFTMWFCFLCLFVFSHPSNHSVLFALFFIFRIHPLARQLKNQATWGENTDRFFTQAPSQNLHFAPNKIRCHLALSVAVARRIGFEKVLFMGLHFFSLSPFHRSCDVPPLSFGLLFRYLYWSLFFELRATLHHRSTFLVTIGDSNVPTNSSSFQVRIRI